MPTAWPASSLQWDRSLECSRFRSRSRPEPRRRSRMRWRPFRPAAAGTLPHPRVARGAEVFPPPKERRNTYRRSRDKVPEGPPTIARQFTGGDQTGNRAHVPEARLNNLRRTLSHSVVPNGTWPYSVLRPGVETAGYYRSLLRDATPIIAETFGLAEARKPKPEARSPTHFLVP